MRGECGGSDHQWTFVHSSHRMNSCPVKRDVFTTTLLETTNGNTIPYQYIVWIAALSSDPCLRQNGSKLHTVKYHLTPIPNDVNTTLTPSDVNTTLIPSDVNTTLSPSDVNITLIPSDLNTTLIPGDLNTINRRVLRQGEHLVAKTYLADYAWRGGGPQVRGYIPNTSYCTPRTPWRYYYYLS